MKVKTHPPTYLILRWEDEYFRLAVIEKGEDESLYFKFLRKDAYCVRGRYESLDVPTQLIFQEVTGSNVYNPYLSYHASSGKVHANGFAAPRLSDKKNKRVLFSDTMSDAKSHLVSHDVFSPIWSIIFPMDKRLYEQIGKRSNSFPYNYLEISDNPSFPRQQVGTPGPGFLVIDKRKVSLLNIEIFVHRDKDVETITPFLSERQKINLIETVKVSGTLGSLSHTILIKGLDSKELLPHVIAFLFNKDKVIGFTFS